ncbi:MAG: hypothetical protein WCJ81_06275 [bacterium]
MGLSAEQLTVAQLNKPIQDQFHGPVPVTEVGVPVEQNPLIGTDVRTVPLVAQQTPAIGVFAIQRALAAPPKLPIQFHLHGPLIVPLIPVTAVGVPVLQSPVVGIVFSMAPLVAQQVPITGLFAVQVLLVSQPNNPLQDQVHGPVQTTALGVPVEQNPVVGAEFKIASFDDPQAPATGVFAVQVLLVAQLNRPVQDRVHGPVPPTVVAFPAEQSPVVGIEVRVEPLAVQQTPAIGTLAVHTELLQPKSP